MGIDGDGRTAAAGRGSSGELKPGTIVLGYHAVSPTWDVDISITPDELERQLGLLVRRGWRGATLRDAISGRTAGRTMVITFDDAFESVLKLAYPILSSLGLPGTVFAPSTFMSARQRLTWSGIETWGPPEEMIGMCWEDLGVLSEAGWEIGSHTRTHPHLPAIDDESLRFELTESRREIAAALGRPCETIAYPYDEVDERVAAAAAAAGYIAGTASKHHLKYLGPLRVPRIGVYRGDVAWRFWLKANGLVRRVRATDYWVNR